MASKATQTDTQNKPSQDPSSMQKQNSIWNKNAIFLLPISLLLSGPTTSLYCSSGSLSDINTTKYLQQHHNHWHLFSDTLTSHSRYIYFIILCKQNYVKKNTHFILKNTNNIYKITYQMYGNYLHYTNSWNQ